MTGSLIDAVFADGVMKDISGFDMQIAYEGLKKHATEPGSADKGYGRRGIEDYLKLGYVAEDHTHQSAAETVDSAYGDFCIAQIAEKLGHKEDAEMFRQRSHNWRKLFDAKTNFLRGKNSDGSWVTHNGEPFDPVRRARPMWRARHGSIAGMCHTSRRSSSKQWAAMPFQQRSWKRW